MSSRGVVSAGMVVGAAAGAFLGAALLTSPVAYGAEALPNLPVPPFPLRGTFDLPGASGLPTDVTNTGIPFLYNGLQQDMHYTISDSASYDIAYNEQNFGGFPAMQGPDNNIFDPLPYYHYVSETVADSTGAAPAAGTVWDSSAAGIPICGVQPAICLDLFLYQSHSLTTAAGTVDFSNTFGIVNEYYQGPAGVFDYVGFAGGDLTPIISIPADGSSAAAVTDLLSAGDLGGLGDLLSAGDLADAGANAGELGALWSDLLSLF